MDRQKTKVNRPIYGQTLQVNLIYCITFILENSLEIHAEIGGQYTVF